MWQLLKQLISPRVRKYQFEYLDDKKFYYILILFTTDGTQFSQIFTTSSPLVTGHRIVLASTKVFEVVHIAHVVYQKDISNKLTRPTTFVHAGIRIAPESTVQEIELSELGFVVGKPILPYTLH